MADLLRYQTTTALAVRAAADAGTLCAVLDACDEPRVPIKVRALGNRAAPLYQGKAQDDLWGIAPYLVQADSALVDWIATSLWTDPWGIFMTTDAPLAELRSHLRRFLLVDAPGGEQWYFRFYDPRVLARFLPSCDPPQLADFFGPIGSFGWVDLENYGVTLVSQARLGDRPAAKPRITFRKVVR